jgi:hypothetical protein
MKTKNNQFAHIYDTYNLFIFQFCRKEERE